MLSDCKLNACGLCQFGRRYYCGNYRRGSHGHQYLTEVYERGRKKLWSKHASEL